MAHFAGCRWRCCALPAGSLAAACNVAVVPAAVAVVPAAAVAAAAAETFVAGSNNAPASATAPKQNIV